MSRTFSRDSSKNNTGNTNELRDCWDLMQQYRTDDQCDRRLERHKRAERRLGESSQGVQLKGPRNQRQKDRRDHRDHHDLRREVPPRLWDTDERDEHCRYRHRDGESVDTCETVTHVLGDDDVQTPADARDRGEGNSKQAGCALPWFGEQHDTQ